MSLSESPTSRSTFSVEASLIFLGLDYDPDRFEPVHNHFVLFHEYLHYEQSTTWPLLLILRLSKFFLTYTSLSGRDLTDAETILKRITNLLFPIDWSDAAVAADQVQSARPGVLALMEAGALFDVYLKPETYFARNYALGRIEEAFGSRDLNRNRLHLIGMESCLASVGLGNQKFKDLGNPAIAAAVLPNLLAVIPMQNVFVSRGINPSGFDVADVYSEINDAGFAVIATEYLNHYEMVSSFVFAEGKYIDLLEDIRNQPGLRDVGIVGTYVLMRYAHNLLFQSMGERIRTYDEGIIIGASLNLLRLYEANNHMTLSKYFNKGIVPLWVPAPTIILSRSVIAGTKYEFVDKESNTFRLRIGDLSDRENLALIATLGYMFTETIIHARAGEEMTARCPLFAAVSHHLRKHGVLDPSRRNLLLRKLCYNLKFDIEGRPLEDEIEPSTSYCCASIGALPSPDPRAGCLFKSLTLAITQDQRISDN